MQKSHTLQGLLALLPLLVPCTARAMPDSASLFSYNVKSHESKYREPSDLLPKIPVLGMIPRSFLFSGGYTVDLSVTEMRIDHMTEGSHCPRKNRSCLLSVSYSQPVGDQLFSSRFDVPLLSASSLHAHWTPASLGDYVIHLSNTPLTSSAVRLMASARF